MIPPYEGRGRQRLLALHETKGVFSFAKENTPFGTPRERRGAFPSTPALAVPILKDCTACGLHCGVHGCAMSLLQNVTVRNRAHSVARV